MPTIPEKLTKAASGSSSAISSPQRVVKPVRDLVGAASFPQRVIQASGGSTSTVSTMQKLVFEGR